MRSLTQDWLVRARDDLKTANSFLADTELTHLVAANCRQCVEKCFRAMAENRSIEMPATYNLIQMRRLFKQYPAELDIELLRKLNDIPDESRNPLESGLLTGPKTAPDEVAGFLDFAKKILEITVEICKDENDWDSSAWNILPFLY